MIEKTKKLNGFMILTITNMLSKILSLIYIPLLSRILTNFGYGVYGATYSVYTFVYMITISGISTAIPKMIAEYMEKNEYSDAIACFKIGKNLLLIFGSLMTIIFIISTKAITIYIGYNSAYLAILSLCPSIFFTALLSAYRGYFQGIQNLKPLGISQLIEQILNVICSVLFSFILMKYNLALGVMGGALGTTVGSIGAYLYLKVRFYQERIKVTKHRYKNNYIYKYIIKYSIPLIISTALIYAGNNMIDLHYITYGLEKAGFDLDSRGILYGSFTQYMQLINTPMILISSLAISVLPFISKLMVKNDKKELSTSINNLINIAFFISIPSAIGLSILSTTIYKVILVPKNSIANEIMLYGAYLFIFSSLYQLTNTIINSIGEVKFGAFNSIIGVIIKIICDILIIPITSINIYGVIIGLIISNFITSSLNLLMIQRKLKIKIQILNNIVKPILSGIAMGIVIYIINKLCLELLKVINFNYLTTYLIYFISLLLCVITGIIVYINLLNKLNGLNEGFLKALPLKAKKLLFYF